MQKDRASAVQVFLGQIRTPDLPSLGPEVRGSRLPLGVVKTRVDEFCRQVGLQGQVQECLRSAALWWHDHLEASHAISQGISSRDGSYLHGMMHRREPDYGNAAYWFRRVGDHPMSREVAGAIAGPLGSTGEDGWLRELLPNAKWDVLAMVRACEVSLQAGDEARVRDLQEVQRLEFEGLVGWVIGAADVT